MNLRTETKYLLNKKTFLYLRERLIGLFPADIHNGESGYVVNSLYFDSNEFKSYYEKEAGDFRKEKWRLRFYGNEQDTLHLEQKIKDGRISQKNIFSKDYPHFLYPKLIVSYTRYAFQENGMRVTLDCNLGFAKAYHESDIFDSEILLSNSEVMVLEVKALPDQKNIELEKIIFSLGLTSSSYSKYAEGIGKIYDL